MDLPETCEDVGAALPLFVGSDLEPAEMDAVRFHLEGCEACSAQARRSASARAVLVGARDASAVDGPSLWNGIRAMLLSEGLIGAGSTSGSRSTGSRSTGSRSTGSSARMTPIRRFGIGSAAAAAAILFAFTLAGQLRPDAPSGPVSPVVIGDRASTVAVSVPASLPASGGSRAVAPELAPELPSERTHDGWQRLRAARDGEVHMLDVAGDYPGQVAPMTLGGQLSGTALVRGR